MKPNESKVHKSTDNMTKGDIMCSPKNEVAPKVPTPLTALEAHLLGEVARLNDDLSDADGALRLAANVWWLNLPLQEQSLWGTTPQEAVEGVHHQYRKHQAERTKPVQRP